MKRTVLYMIMLICGIINDKSFAQDALLNGFGNPPASAKARTWWHWINGNVSRTGITADLMAMKAAGIQEAQIFNVDQGYPNGEATFLGPIWMEVFKFAVTESERLGLDIGFHNGAGWSSSGGPWVTPELAMQTVVFTETQLKGGRTIRQQIPKPATKLNYYQDIATIAFPTPKSKQRIQNLELKSLSKDAFKTKLLPDDAQVDQAALVDKNSIIDLSGKIRADGLLNWEAPSGSWTIIRFGHTPTGAENRPAGLGGKGLEVNKLSVTAVEAYWNGGIKPILDKIGASRKSLVNCLIDSYEVGCNNWTTGFPKEFESRRKYNCLSFLPTLAGYYVQSGEISERFLWDFRKTIGDLIAENYYGKFRELCHKNGLRISLEPYGGPFDAFQVGASGDIAMSEFWMGRKEYSESSKLVSSISHLNGNAITGAESFTSLGGWINHPATLKPAGDFIWTEGVNRFIYHTYVHQPWNIGPGVTFHMYGVELSRLNTWWTQSKAYFDYVAKSQFLLQQGQSFADVLVFTGESSPNDGSARPDIKALGYDYDQIGPHEFAHLSTKDGRIYSRSGLSYRVLLLPESKWATPELMKKIKMLIDGGASIAGMKPSKSPSLTNYPQCDLIVSELADEIWPDKVQSSSNFTEVARRLNLEPDFSGGVTGGDLNYIHRVSGEDDIYFISNPKNEVRHELCSFRISGKQPELWDAEKGTSAPVSVWNQVSASMIQIPITMAPNQSIFLVFRANSFTQIKNNLISVKSFLNEPPLKPLLDLKILKAEYGTFLPAGMTDVTAAVQRKINGNKIMINADNNLSDYDPAPGSVKSLRLSYQLSGEKKYIEISENEQFKNEFPAGTFQIIRAVYGKFPEDCKGLPPINHTRDVTAKINELINSKKLVFSVSDSLIGEAVNKDKKDELRLRYQSEGNTTDINRREGEILDLSGMRPWATTIHKNGITTFVSPTSGYVEYTSANGHMKKAVVKKVPKEMTLSGSWEVVFPDLKNSLRTKKVVFPKLVSWSQLEDKDLRYFSGTASYFQQINLPKAMLKPEHSLELDLGSVHVIAEVVLNGKNLGILWTPPFRVPIGSAAREGINQLEIRITNLWPNRLIGDAQLPDDVAWGDYVPKEWPTWLKDDTFVRQSNRVTFSTWKHWDDKSTLLTSGMLGPVVIRAYSHTQLPTE